MSATYLGSISIGQAFPGFEAVIVPVRAAFATLRAAVDAAIVSVANVQSQINSAINISSTIGNALTFTVASQIDLLVLFRLDIRRLALADIQLQLNAALAIEADLGIAISDPVAAIQGLITAVGSVQLDLAALVPQVAVAAQLGAAVAIRLEMEAKIAAFDLALAALDPITTALNGMVSAILGIVADLNALLAASIQALTTISLSLGSVLTGSLGPFSALVSLEADLALGSLEMYRYDGVLSAQGNGVDASVTANSLLAGSTPVRSWTLVCPNANIALQTKLNSLLKIA